MGFIHDRKSSALFHALFHLGWPMAAGIAFGVATISFLLIPALFGSNDFISQLLITVEPFLWAIVAFFLLLASLKFLTATPPNVGRFDPNLHPIEPIDTSRRNHGVTDTNKDCAESTSTHVGKSLEENDNA